MLKQKVEEELFRRRCTPRHQEEEVAKGIAIKAGLVGRGGVLQAGPFTATGEFPWQVFLKKGASDPQIRKGLVVEGIAVKDTAVERAIGLAMEKYCSASAQMAALADIRTSYEIIEVGQP